MTGWGGSVAKIVDLGEHHVGKRYIVSSWQGRRKEFTHLVDAYAEFYFLESTEWEECSEERWLRKKQFTLEKLIDFYFGERCWRFNLTDKKKNIAINTFRKAKGSFDKKHQFNALLAMPIGQVSVVEVRDLNLNKSRIEFLKAAFQCAQDHGIYLKPKPLNKLESRVQPRKNNAATRTQMKRLFQYAQDHNKPRLELFMFSDFKKSQRRMEEDAVSPIQSFKRHVI